MQSIGCFDHETFYFSHFISDKRDSVCRTQTSHWVHLHGNKERNISHRNIHFLLLCCMDGEKIGPYINIQFHTNRFGRINLKVSSPRNSCSQISPS